MAIDYVKIFGDLVLHYSDLVSQRKKIEVELARLAQTIESTFKLLTPAQQGKVAQHVNKSQWQFKGLKQGVLTALKARSGEWLTPPEVRDYLMTIGFNFGTASANGLASIGTTLKRLVPEEVEAKPLAGGQIAYRIRGYDALSVINAETQELLRKDSEKRSQ